MTRPLALVMSVVLLGCAPPVRIGLDSPDPQGRTIALARAADGADEASVPKMIDLLNSVDPAQRFLAIKGLENRTGETFGYVHYAPEAERIAAQERWAAWWAEQNQETGG